jgi:hypothetical protein
MKPTTKTKNFDAVAESRRWKRSVSEKTAGMTRDQLLSFFDKERVLAALTTPPHVGCEADSLREDPPTL